jgi:hypothetical protein
LADGKAQAKAHLNLQKSIFNVPAVRIARKTSPKARLAWTYPKYLPALAAEKGAAA